MKISELIKQLQRYENIEIDCDVIVGDYKLINLFKEKVATPVEDIMLLEFEDGTEFLYIGNRSK